MRLHHNFYNCEYGVKVIFFIHSVYKKYVSLCLNKCKLYCDMNLKLNCNYSHFYLTGLPSNLLKLMIGCYLVLYLCWALLELF